VSEPRRRIARAADGRITVLLAPREREILGSLAAELAAEVAAVSGGAGEHDEGPSDPGLDRLRPDAVAGDRAASDAFRELTGADLEAARQARFATLAATIDRASIDDAEASAWLGAVNDLRLVRGTRLGVTEETGQKPLDEQDPNAGATVLYLWLGWVQEELVETLAAALPEVEADAG